MEQISIRQVAAWTGGRYDGPDLPVLGVSIDSRSVERGQLFVALSGARSDGHAYLGEAFASGAAAALVQSADAAGVHRAMGRPVVEVEDTARALRDLAAAYRQSLDLKVVGVTGSNGKTTTKEMLRLVLGPQAVVSPHSYNNAIGVPLTLLQANRHHRVCVVEMGTNAPGEIADLARIARPDVGVILNVAESHLEGLGDVEGVAREKGALVEALGAEGCAILNWDDERTRAMMARAPGYVMSFGTWPRADVFAADVRTQAYALSFKFLGRLKVRLRLIGVHNVHNALAAASVGLWLKEDPVTVCTRLEQYRPAPMRMSVASVGRVRLINDAYNANPRSVTAALQEMSVRAGGRRIAVLGDMLELGARAPELHARIGEQVARSRIDVLWAVGPLSEATARAARSAGVRSVFWSPDVAEAVARPPLAVKDRDVVLFKASRGVRLERVYDAVKGSIKARRRTRAPQGSGRQPA